jgi:hypothetical protein
MELLRAIHSGAHLEGGRILRFHMAEASAGRVGGIRMALRRGGRCGGTVRRAVVTPKI